MKSSVSARSRGQILVIMAVVLAAVILAVSTMIYLTATQSLFFNYNPSREIVLSIDADFHRALTRILANVTCTYNKTGIRTPEDELENAMYVARMLANQTFSYWDLATRAAYAGKGLNMEVQWVDEVIQKAKSMSIKIGSEAVQCNYSERSLGRRLFKLFWYRPNSISAIGADINIDSVAKGIVGWRSRHIVLLNLTITAIKPKENENMLDVDVVVLKEGGAPVNDLRVGNFEIYIFDPTVKLKPGEFWWQKIPPEKIYLTYNGGGNYTITIKNPLKNPKDKNADSFWSFYYGFILLRVKDNREIIVEAYSYSGIEYIIRERAIEIPGSGFMNDPRKTEETYIFELLPNGTIAWNFMNLNFDSTSTPIPLLPVKQIRVQATRNGPDSDFVDIDYQIENWDDTFLWPNEKEFITGYRRLMNGSKIVFQINYPPGVNKQKVRVIWLDDCDADMPTPIPWLEYEAGIQVAYTKYYTLMLVVDRNEASQHYHHIDWTMSLRPKGAPTDVEYIGGIDYMLIGYGAYKSGTTYYIPYKIPEDRWKVLPASQEDPISGKSISRAIVRAVAFRNTSRVVTTVEPIQVITNEIRHNAIMYIPYNAPYFQIYINATWLRDVNIEYSYLLFMGIIGGRIEDDSNQVLQKYKWGSLLDPGTNKAVNGTFGTQAGVYIIHRGYALGSRGGDGSYSHWVALYNESFGAAIFASEQMIKALEDYGKRYGNKDQLFIWTRRSGASRFMEYDAIAVESSGGTEIRTRSTPKIEFKAAGFVLHGGAADETYSNPNVWNNGADSRALPFRRVKDPVVEETGSGELGELIRVDRKAFIADDFSTNPFTTRRLTTTGDGWSWNQQGGYIEVSADRTGTGGERLYYAYYANNRIPAGTRIYMLSNIYYTTTANDQHVGLIMANQQTNRFYMFEFYRDSNNRRLGIWHYGSGGWSYLSRTGNLNLPDGRWSVFLGSRVISGTGNGRMELKVYSGAGEQGPGPATDTSLTPYYLGFGIRDPNRDNRILTARFDYFVACVDADPRFVTVKGLSEGWRVVIRDDSGFQVQNTAGPDGIVQLDVSSKPIIKNGIIEIYKSEAEFISKRFGDIVGGDVYRNIVGKLVINAADKCSMYYRMFLDSYAPTIDDVNPVYTFQP